MQDEYQLDSDSSSDEEERIGTSRRDEGNVEDFPTSVIKEQYTGIVSCAFFVCNVPEEALLTHHRFSSLMLFVD